MLLAILVLSTGYQRASTCQNALELRQSFRKLSQLTRKSNSIFTKRTSINQNGLINANVRFHFQSELIELLNQLNFSRLSVQIRQYAKTKWDHSFYSVLFQGLEQNNNNRSCHINGTIEKCFANGTLESVDFVFKDHGDFIICASLFDPHTLLGSDQMCQDWSIKGTSSAHMYKPLFIVLMYVLCFLFLCPIAISYYFTYTPNKFKLERRRKAQVTENDDCMKLLVSRRLKFSQKQSKFVDNCHDEFELNEKISTDPVSQL